jgi:hypothetical protein
VPTRDRFLQRRWSRDHYEANKDAYKARATAQRRDRKVAARAIIKAAKDVPCADCGLRYPSYVMQFDHVRGVKEFDVATFTATNRPLSHLHREIAKCEVVCGNCHAIRTHRRRMDRLADEATAFGETLAVSAETEQTVLFLSSGRPPRALQDR